MVGNSGLPGAIGVHVRFLIGIAYRRNLRPTFAHRASAAVNLFSLVAIAKRKTATAKPASTPNTFSINPPAPTSAET